MATGNSRDKLYMVPAVQRPTIEQLRSVAEALHLHISADELEEYKSVVSEALSMYDRVDKLVEPTPSGNRYAAPVGTQPPSNINPYNAWARMTEIVGASSGKLSGKTLAIKDNMHIAGVPMTCGSNFLRGFVSSSTATVVARILDAGGRIRGKATCEDWCFCGSSYTSASGPVLNPFDTTRSSGGSSSGSAVLVTIGDVDMALGSDTGGSVRLPSCWCGIVGLKPTYGLVPFTGVMAMDECLDHVGPMARTVHDCALLLEVIAGYDNGLDPAQPANITVPNYSEQLTGDVSGLRVGMMKEGFDGAEDDVAETVKAAANSLKQLGVTVEEFDFPPLTDLKLAGFILAIEGTYDTYRNGGLMPRNAKGFKDTAFHDFMYKATRTDADSLPISMKSVVLMSHYVRENYGCHFYAKAVNAIRGIKESYDELFERYDIVIVPTIKYKPALLPKVGLTVTEYLKEHARNTDNTFPVNATGNPALTINAGFSSSEPHLPIGMTMIGRHFEDLTVLRLAHAYERLRNASPAYSDVETRLRSAMKSQKH